MLSFVRWALQFTTIARPDERKRGSLTVVHTRDEYGEYRRTEQWVSAWPGGGNYVPGWCLCELREYVDGVTRVHRAAPTYLHEAPLGFGAIHATYLIASKALGAQSRTL